MAAFLGLASWVLLGWKAIRRAESLAPFLASVTISLCASVAFLALCALAGLEPRVYDYYLYRFDASLGGQTSAVVGRWFRQWPLLASICWICYEALPLAQGVLLASYLRAQRLLRHFFLTVGLAGIAGCALYRIMPVIGPAHIFGPSFVSEMHRSVPLATAATTQLAPRNGLPSLHLAWALLIFWNVKPGHRRGRILAFVFLIPTILATLGSGEHYLVDLIVAVPFALSVQNGCLRRWKEMGLHAAITLLWIAYLRFGMPYLEPSQGAAWLASGITLFLPFSQQLMAACRSLHQRMIRQQELAAARGDHIQFRCAG